MGETNQGHSVIWLCSDQSLVNQVTKQFRLLYPLGFHKPCWWTAASLDRGLTSFYHIGCRTHWTVRRSNLGLNTLKAICIIHLSVVTEVKGYLVPDFLTHSLKIFLLWKENKKTIYTKLWGYNVASCYWHNKQNFQLGPMNVTCSAGWFDMCFTPNATCLMLD